MKRLRSLATSESVALAAAAASLGLPPASYGAVPASWSTVDGVQPELELEIWTTSTAVALTSAVMYGATPHPLVYADATVTGAASTNKITKATHGLFTGDGPFTFTNVGGILPGGVLAGVEYWVIKFDANTFFLALSLHDALTNVQLDLTADSTGTTTIHDTDDTERLWWTTHDGLLGLSGNGAVSLTAQVGYRKRLPHSPRVVAYALVGTLDTGTLSAAIYPIEDSGR